MHDVHEIKKTKKLLSDLTLLYVEDEKTLRGSNETLYKKLFKEVYTAQNGKQGLELFKTHSPDMIVTDINMPVMDGIEMSKIIKEENKEIPIIVFTAFNDEKLLIQLIDIGIDAFLNKPADYQKSFAAFSKTARYIKTKRELAEKNTLLIQQARNAAMGEILSQVAHHWRQPLSTISLMIQKLPFIKTKGQLDDVYLENMVKESVTLINSMSQTIDVFTSFSKQADENSVFNLKESVDEALQLTLPELTFNNITVETEIDAALKVVGSKGDFQQSLLKLLSNAKDAINHTAPEEGHIYLEAETGDNDTIEFSVCDNGGGIDDEVIEKIFDPYHTTKGLAAGTGLSLYIVKMIIEGLMQGKIRAENNSEGATITLTLHPAGEETL